jgi:iron complex outermembrane receptor protein
MAVTTKCTESTTRVTSIVLLLFVFVVEAPAQLNYDEEVTVVAATPVGGVGIAPGKLPFNVQSASSDSLDSAQSVDLSEYLSTNLASVNINSAQSNPLQPDVQYRGYSASPLLGLPMGIAVYQNGVRINEPLGDSVNWDLLPESAVHSMSLIGGANPLFGLNTLGGALSVEMKNGFNFAGHALEFNGGSWDRKTVTAESGGNNGTFGYYLNISYFDEQGWRDLSASDTTNVYGTISWHGQVSTLDFSGHHGESELTGNGAAPVGLIALDRSAIFTAPDITENDMHMFTANATHAFSESLEFSGNGFFRENATTSFNGDISEFAACELGGGEFLIEGLEDEQLEPLGFDADELCETDPGLGGVIVGGVTPADPDALEDALNQLAGAELFELEDLTDSVSGTRILRHGAINNQSVREQQTFGADVQFTFTENIFGEGNYLVGGVTYFDGKALFSSVLELSEINPMTRSTAGLGVGSFVDDEAANVGTESVTSSVYFMDALDLNDRVTLTLGGRFNRTEIRIRDRSDQRPELDGDHVFNRFNPSVGLTYSPLESLNLYAGYSESSRAPTPIELSCNEGVFEVAREAALARGDDPDEVDFECRLPNAFLADPPLNAVIAKSFELGMRGRIGDLRHRIGLFHTTNKDDIIFQTTGRSTGLFANVDETVRQGVESAFSGTAGLFDWSFSYTYLDASFGNDFLALSPTHDFANDSGEIQVRDGDRIPGIPEHLLKLGGNYNFDSGVLLGFDFIYNSNQVLRGDESNQLDEIDGYATVNLRAAYRFNENFSFSVRVTNLFDTEYENFGILGEDPADAVAGLTDTRPRFLGAGAPRGVWAGIRILL